MSDELLVAPGCLHDISIHSLIMFSSFSFFRLSARGFGWLALTLPLNVLAQTLVAEAGFDLTAIPAAVVTLDGRQSYASSGQPLQYAWQQIRGPKLAISDRTSSRPTLITPARLPVANQRQLVFRLTVTDGRNGTASDEITVTLTSSSICTASNGVCPTPPRFNDSGITQCSDTHIYGIPCPLSLYPGQDGDYGRDAVYPGQTAFSFTRIDSKGQAVNRATQSWACVRDNVTGLMWENKTQGGLHDVRGRYTYSASGTQAGNHDVATWIRQVNREGLCGFKDWRLPSLVELQSLVDYGIPFPGPTLTAESFQYTLNEPYWTASNDSRRSGQAWVVLFDDGQVYSHTRTNEHPVRLVRGATLSSRWFIDQAGQEVTDKTSGLVWKRCVEGTRWNGESCVGLPRYFTWYEALQAVVPGEAGWRVPNIKEMSSLIDPTAIGTLAMNTQIFPQTPNDMFWTASPYTLDTFYGWVVQSFYGYAYFTYLEDTATLRLVRDR